MNPVGRPSSFTQATADAICERLVEGESLRSICRADEMPSICTVFKWLAAHSEFADQYARAREVQAETLADEIVDIADDNLGDYTTDEEGNKRVDHDHIARARLRVDARKWVASKLKPKKYGEKIHTELTGADGGPILSKTANADDLTDEQLAAIASAGRAASAKPEKGED